jgi:predicted DsbA family dithiol-disulfide isomerase
VDPIRFVVYSDYLCPWCYNASVRLRRLREEFGDAVEFEWRSYLLRTRPAARRDVEKFRSYTRSWLTPGAEEDAGRFRAWVGEAAPPSHSVPPHLVAKAAGTLGPDAFEAVHDRLLEAYFFENRDISDGETLRSIWSEAGLPAEEFRRREDPALLRATLEEHREAQASGVTGVPALRLAGEEAVIVGAHPLELYRRWITRTRDARAADAGAAP